MAADGRKMERTRKGLLSRSSCVCAASHSPPDSLIPARATERIAHNCNCNNCSIDSLELQGSVETN